MERSTIEVEYKDPVRNAKARATGLTNTTLQTLAIASTTIVALVVLALLVLA